MGCCEIRSERKDIDTGLKSSIESYNKAKPNTLLDSTSEQQAESSEALCNYSLSFVEDYSAKLIASANWLTHIDQDKITIRTIPGSAYNAKIPVVLGFLEFECEIPTEKISKLVCQDRSWDHSVIQYNVIETSEEFFKVRVLKKFPFRNREYFVKVFWKNWEDSSSIVMIPEEIKFEKDDMVESGEIIFTMVKIQKREKNTVMFIISQVDNKQEKANNLCRLVATEMHHWLMVLRTKAVSLVKL